MKTLLLKKKQNTEDEHLELLELKKDLSALAETILEDADEIDAFFEDQLREKKNASAIVPKSNWRVIKRYLEQWRMLGVTTTTES